MATQNSAALAKRSADTALMPPPPRPKRIKRPPRVLDEDTYTSALSHIIARDFFPGLLETETQQEYLDALESQDQVWINEAEGRVRAMMTPGPEGRSARGRRGVSLSPAPGMQSMTGATPITWRGETPTPTLSTPGGTSRAQVSPGKSTEHDENIDMNMGLSAFQARYTSEDNESFNKLLDKQNAKRAQKYDWVFNGNRLPSKRQIAQEARKQKLLEATTLEKNYGPRKDNQLVLLNHERSKDQRRAMIDIRPSKPKNGLMFMPEDLEETNPTLISVAQTAQEKSKAPPKAVNFDNTRIPVAPNASEDDIIPPSPSMSAIDAAIAGHPRPRGPLSSAVPSSVTGGETPRVNGYTFVDEEPTASELAAVSTEAYTTGLAQNSTLLSDLVKANNKDGDDLFRATPFTISATSKREDLHHRLVEKTARAKRHPPTDRRLADVQQAGRTPTPRFMSSPRIAQGAGGLTPAAQRLYGKITAGDAITPREGIGGGSAFDSRTRAKKGAATPKPAGLKPKTT